MKRLFLAVGVLLIAANGFAQSRSSREISNAIRDAEHLRGWREWQANWERNIVTHRNDTLKKPMSKEESERNEMPRLADEQTGNQEDREIRVAVRHVRRPRTTYFQSMGLYMSGSNRTSEDDRKDAMKAEGIRLAAVMARPPASWYAGLGKTNATPVVAGTIVVGTNLVARIR